MTCFCGLFDNTKLRKIRTGLRTLGVRYRRFLVCMSMVVFCVAVTGLLVDARRQPPPKHIFLDTTRSPSPTSRPDWDRDTHHLDNPEQPHVNPSISPDDRADMPADCLYYDLDIDPLVVDETGRVCDLLHWDAVSGCCLPSKAFGQHVCERCMESHPFQRVEIPGICCASNVDCISCCMKDAKEGKSRKQRFGRCMHYCRTTSRSIYEPIINPSGAPVKAKEADRKHCFREHKALKSLEHFEQQAVVAHREHHEEQAALELLRKQHAAENAEHLRLIMKGRVKQQ